MEMKKEEIINNGKFILNSETPEFSEFEILLFIPFFDQDVKVLFQNLVSLDSIPEVNLIVEIVNELLEFPDKNKVWLKKEIWNHYETYVSNTSYGFVTLKGFSNQREANMAYFNIRNENEAFENVQLEMIYTDLSFLDFRYFNLIYKCPWENEHGISIGIMNGEFNSII